MLPIELPPELLTPSQEVHAHATELLEQHFRLYAIDLTLYFPSMVDSQQLQHFFDWMQRTAWQHHLVGYTLTHQSYYLTGGRVRGIVYLLPSAMTENWYVALIAYLMQHLPGTELRDFSYEPTPVHIRNTQDMALLRARLTVLMLKPSGIPISHWCWNCSLEQLQQIYDSMRA